MVTQDSPLPLFRLDLANRRLWCGEQLVPLYPKSWAVLHCLVDKRGTILSIEELHKAVWPHKAVSTSNVKVQIRKLRKALHDSPHEPRFIQTHSGVGYSFIGAVQHLGVGIQSLGTAAAFSSLPLPPHLVGRKEELNNLYAQLNKAVAGQRQFVLVSGEAGLGKTTLVRAFQEQLADTPVWVAAGQCTERRETGPGEAYAPLLDAWGGTLAKRHQATLRSVLHQCAPTWLAQLPALTTQRRQPAPLLPDPSPQRSSMPRELAQAIDALTAQAPLVLILDDLHWSDPSTLSVVAMLARRRELARFLLIGVYRPEEVYDTTHPLRSLLQDVRAHRFCTEVDVSPLAETEVRSYLANRFPTNVFPAQLASTLRQRTEGNPLFLADLIETLEHQGALACGNGKWSLAVPIETLATAMPTSFRSLLDRRIEYLMAEERELLAAASIVGHSFSATMVAHMLRKDVVRIEELCEALVEKRYFLLRAGVSEGPAGASSTRYRFRNRLVHEAWLSRLPAAQKQHLQQCMEKHPQGTYVEEGKE